MALGNDGRHENLGIVDDTFENNTDEGENNAENENNEEKDGENNDATADNNECTTLPKMFDLQKVMKKLDSLTQDVQ